MTSCVIGQVNDSGTATAAAPSGTAIEPPAKREEKKLICELVVGAGVAVLGVAVCQLACGGYEGRRGACIVLCVVGASSLVVVEWLLPGFMMVTILKVF